MIRRFFISLLLLTLIGVGVGARAENAAILNVSVDHGIPLTLNSPAASVFIANPDVADIQVMSPTSVMIFGKKTGETTLLATDGGGRTILYRTIVVSQDLSDLRRELATAIPDNKIEVQALPDGIVLTGETKDPISVVDAQKMAQRYVTKDGQIINRVRVVGSNQIMLRVRFAEVSRSVDKEFGIDWGSALSFGGFVFGIVSGNPVVNTAASGVAVQTTGINASDLGIGNGVITPGSATAALTAPFSRTNNSALAKPNDMLSLSHAGNHFNINGLIDALAQDGLITILAEPNLTAMSGETANFLAGGEFPIPIPQANGTISIEFKPYGISLSFTPTLIGQNRINLHVKPEVSQLTSVGSVTLNNIAVPALSTRKAETTVELASGQSFAIAGLLDNSQDQTINKYPFLGDLPILGPLFRSTQFQNNQTELVILITPYVVKPGMSEQAMALPTDGFSPPSESERLLGLRNSSSDPDARPMSGDVKALPAPPPATKFSPESSLAPPVPAAALAPPTTPNNLVVGRTLQDNDGGNSEPIPAAAPVTPVSANPALSGTGGFLLE